VGNAATNKAVGQEMLTIPPLIVLFNITASTGLFKAILSGSVRATTLWLVASMFGVGCAMIYTSTWLFLVSLALLVFVIIAADQIVKHRTMEEWSRRPPET
jgi:hypothetical protein